MHSLEQKMYSTSRKKYIIQLNHTGIHRTLPKATCRVIAECDLTGLETGQLVALRGDEANQLLVWAMEPWIKKLPE